MIDQMGRRVEVPTTAKRIVSLVPSQTELLFDLGLDEEVVGITKFCIHPKHWLQQKTIVGGTKKFRFDVIDALEPDLIIGNKEENYREGIEELALKYPVWMSDIFNISQALEMMMAIGQMTGKPKEVARISDKVKSDFAKAEIPKKGTAVYLIWQKPYMAIGSETFINQMLRVAGYENALSERERYPEIGIGEIVGMQPDHLLLSSEPFPFQEKHRQVIQNQLPRTKVKLVDGEMFSWYGSRLTKAIDYFRTL